jgi:hypothetical protein
MKDIRKLIETINALTEGGIKEETLEDTIETEVPEIKSTIEDTMSTADKLAAKTKIARALEVLKDAIEEFKDASVEKVDLLKDEELLGAIEGLDLAVGTIEKNLNPESDILDNPLNAAFKDELPAEDEEEEAEETADDEELELGTEEEDEEDEEDEEEHDFDAEASLDLLNGAE